MAIGYGCSSGKTLFNTTLEDGSRVSIHQLRYKDEANSVFVIDRDQTGDKTHYEYLVDATKCDTIVKKKFHGKEYTIHLLTNQKEPDYPLTDVDKRLFAMLQPHIEYKNTCFEKTIKDATGFIIIKKGKR